MSLMETYSLATPTLLDYYTEPKLGLPGNVSAELIHVIVRGRGIGVQIQV